MGQALIYKFSYGSLLKQQTAVHVLLSVEELFNDPVFSESLRHSRYSMVDQERHSPHPWRAYSLNS